MGDPHSNLIAGIFGLVFLIVGLVLVWLRARKASETKAVRAVAVGATADVAKAQPGSPVAVEGTIECDAPLVGPFSNLSCVYYSETVVDNWEETKRDSDGNDTTEQKSRTVSSNIEHVPFRVADASGTIRIAPDKAKVAAPRTHRRDEPASLGMLSFGVKSARRVFEEWALGVGTSAYVLGVLQADGSIGAAGAGTKHVFIIDHRKGQERLNANLKALTYYAWGAGACLAVGVALLVFQLLQHG